MAQDPLSLIAKRKAEMEASRAKEQAERARLDEEAAARAKEEEEIAIAEKVFARLAQKEAAPEQSSTAGSSTQEASAAAKSAALTKIPAAGGSKRPKGIPTVPQMVIQLLEDAEARGLKGLKSNEIMEGINSRWWPGVSVNLVMPTVYRCISRDYYFGKQGKLIVRLRDRDPPKRDGEQLKLQ